MSKKAHNRRHWLTEGIAKFWWVMSILFVVLSIAVVLALRCSHSHWVQAVVVAGWLLFVPLLLVQLIILAVIRCWGKLVASSAVGVASVGIVGFLLARIGIRLTWRFVTMLLAAVLWPVIDPSDGFGKEHPIPEGTEYCIPLECNFDVVDGKWVTEYEEAMVDSNIRASYLQIWNDSEGGRYLYDFSFSALPAGTLFLKCYEVGDNIPLSENVMRRNTSVSCSATKFFTKLVEKREFVIYEGDWEDYYAVRVEVWHRESATRQEVKLMEKVYRMDGWMR